VEIVQTNLDSALGREAAQLRTEVFVREQNVPADMEMDEYDAAAAHFVVLDGNRVVGTLRVVDLLKDRTRTAKIGRVAVARELRGRGIGRRLMIAAIDYAKGAGFAACCLTAQVPVIGFYEKLGFSAHGPVFDECGINHRAMTLVLQPL
jgi:predicted GNAT family N-acyltransferase